MSQTYVVRTVAGTWAMGCCDAIHPESDMPHAEFDTKSAAEREAKAHRAEDRTERAAYEARIGRCCPTCGAAR